MLRSPSNGPLAIFSVEQIHAVDRITVGDSINRDLL